MRSPVLHHATNRRAGVAALWVIIWLPVLLIMICFVLNVTTLWLARVELENSMEAAALAAVHDWGKNPETTDTARQIGVEFAGFNRIRGLPKSIDSNLGAVSTENPNANLHCDANRESLLRANLIFGAISEEDPNFPVTFDAGLRPSCGAGGVLVDTTGQGNLEAESAGGIAFLRTAETPADLKIQSILIDLRGGDGGGSFAGGDDDIVWPDEDPPFAVNNPHTNQEQPDIAGLDVDEIDIQLPNSYQLQLTFPTDGDADETFDPGDRLRFGFEVDNVSSGNGNDDGDGIGRDGVTVTITFSLNGVTSEVTATLEDNEHSRNDCVKTDETDDITGDLIVHPTLIPNLPCPAASATGNNGQSFVLVGATGNRRFSVRAQSYEQIELFGPKLLGLGSRCIFAKATAEYDCQTGRVRLIRVDRFICP